MPVWRRYLVRQRSGRLVELPSRKYDRAEDGVAPIPDFAGQCVDLVSAVMVSEQGEQPRIAEVAFTKLYFDSSGFVDASKRDRMIRLMLESCADRRCRNSVHPGCATLAERAVAARDQLEHEFGWRPAPNEVSEVLHRLDLARAEGASPTVH
ncbi:MAG TPA: hypothetical protein VD995_17860 [Azospirillum sp.]|nr:hypothetical protein [Azospirillum sp.]